MRFFQDWRADAIVAKQRAQARERFVKLLRISKRGFKQSELLRDRPNWLRAQRDGHDRMFGFKILQMRLEHPKEKIDIVRRLRDFKNALVTSFIRERDRERQFARDQINAAQSER